MRPVMRPGKLLSAGGGVSMTCLVEGQKFFDDSKGMEGSSSDADESQMESRYGAMGMSAGRPPNQGSNHFPSHQATIHKGMCLYLSCDELVLPLVVMDNTMIAKRELLL